MAVESFLGSRRDFVVGDTSRDVFPQALAGRGVYVHRTARSMMGQDVFCIMPCVQQIRLVGVTGADLGINRLTRYGEILQRASERGWSKCPSEVGPQMLLQGYSHRIHEWSVVAMDGIPGNERLNIFGLEGGRNCQRIFAFPGDLNSLWSPITRFVFSEKV